MADSPEPATTHTHITLEELAKALKLPKNVHLHDVSMDDKRHLVCLHLEAV